MADPLLQAIDMRMSSEWEAGTEGALPGEAAPRRQS
jgi:hypothetical protein